ncbi:MAG: DUF1080 domain-containing protein [Gemmatimonadetes bacterium]|nr:DUF1080 domain-containing protein [Gemmatimonadota bacterium]
MGHRRFAACSAAALVAAACVGGGDAVAGQQEHNTLTAAERAAGWQLLFDGTTTNGWRGFRLDDAPDGWQASDGALTRVGGGGDIITTEQFGDFELTLEWKVEEGGNSGVLFRVTEEADRVWKSGPELQILDNERHPDGRVPATSAGSNYGLHAPMEDAVHPAGSWNAVRLVVQQHHVEHWLNGVKVVEYDLGTPEWEEMVAATKFDTLPFYGRVPAGHIALQDHGDWVAYRNIKILRLP